MDQLAIIKEMVCVQQVEKNYDYNLLATEMPVISDERRRELADLSAIPEKDEEAAADVSSAGLSETQVQQQILPAADAVRLAHEQGVRGQGIKIALFDTGVSSHPDLQVAGGVSFIENSSYSIDSDGHGTRMAGIIAACGAGDAADGHVKIKFFRLIRWRGYRRIRGDIPLIHRKRSPFPQGEGWSVLVV